MLDQLMQIVATPWKFNVGQMVMVVHEGKIRDSFMLLEIVGRRFRWGSKMYICRKIGFSEVYWIEEKNVLKTVEVKKDEVCKN